MPVLLLTVFLAAGFAFGRFSRLPEGAARFTGLAITVLLFLMVFLLGAKLGGDEGLAAQLGSISVQALLLGAACTAGGVLLAGGWAVLRKRGGGKR